MLFEWKKSRTKASIMSWRSGGRKSSATIERSAAALILFLLLARSARLAFVQEKSSRRAASPDDAVTLAAVREIRLDDGGGVYNQTVDESSPESVELHPEVVEGDDENHGGDDEPAAADEDDEARGDDNVHNRSVDEFSAAEEEEQRATAKDDEEDDADGKPESKEHETAADEDDETRGDEDVHNRSVDEADAIAEQEEQRATAEDEEDEDADEPESKEHETAADEDDETRGDVDVHNRSVDEPAASADQEEQSATAEDEEEGDNANLLVFVGYLSAPANRRKRDWLREHCFPQIRAACMRFNGTATTSGDSSIVDGQSKEGRMRWGNACDVHFFIGHPNDHNGASLRQGRGQGILATDFEINLAHSLRNESQHFGDIQMLPMRDTYADLPVKTLSIMRRGVQSGAEMILKIDDDHCPNMNTVLRIARSTTRHQARYVGNYQFNGTEYDIMKGADGSTAPYMSGPGYLLSWALAHAVAFDDINNSVLYMPYGSSSEDVDMGKWVLHAEETHPNLEFIREIVFGLHAPSEPPQLTPPRNPKIDVPFPDWFEGGLAQCQMPPRDQLSIRGDAEGEKKLKLRLKTRNKIAFLLMERDTVSFPKVWRQYFRDAISEHYILYIHLEGKQIPNTMTYRELQSEDPELFSLPESMLGMSKHVRILKTVTDSTPERVMSVFRRFWREALAGDKTVGGFIPLSGSCLPMKRFSYLHQSLVADRAKSMRAFRSILNFANEKRNKAALWGYMTRWAVLKMLRQDGNATQGEDFCSDLTDDTCQPQMIERLGLPNQHGVVTFDCWSLERVTSYTANPDGMKLTSTYPCRFSSVDSTFMERLVGSGAFFAREFKVGASVHDARISVQRYLIEKVLGNSTVAVGTSTEATGVRADKAKKTWKTGNSTEVSGVRAVKAKKTLKTGNSTVAVATSAEVTGVRTDKAKKMRKTKT